MKRKLIWTVCLFCLTMITGCAQKAAESNVHQTNQINQPIVAAYLAANPAVKSGIDAQQIQGDIENIFYAGNATALIDAGKLYLYDLQVNKILAETQKESLVQPRYQACGNGFAAIGDIQPSMNGKIIFYNSSLKKVSELTFSQITGTNEILFSDSFAVSPDGKKIAYADYHGVSIFHTATKSRTRILSLDDGIPSSVKNDLMHIAQLLFSSDNQTVIFLSGVDNGNGQSIPACGKINVDGTGFVNNTISGFTPYEIVGSYGEFAFLGEDDRYASGRILSLDTATGSTQFLPLATKQEGVSFGSDNGAYYATGALNETECTVRIYETATGTKIFEQRIPHGGNPLYVARNPVIRIWDKTKTCIVLMGNRQEDLDTKITYFQF